MKLTDLMTSQVMTVEPDASLRDAAAIMADLRLGALPVYDGHTHQSIADALGMPLGTVKTHLRRGLMRIRDAMKAQDVGSGGEAAP